MYLQGQGVFLDRLQNTGWWYNHSWVRLQPCHQLRLKAGDLTEDEPARCGSIGTFTRGNTEPASPGIWPLCSFLGSSAQNQPIRLNFGFGGHNG